MSQCGKYLILYAIRERVYSHIYFADLEKIGKITGKLSLTQVVTESRAVYEYVTNNGTKFTFRTSKNASNYHLVVIDIENPAEDNWKTLIPEHPNDVLMSVNPVDNDRIFTVYLRDVKSVLQVRSLVTGALIHEYPPKIADIHEISCFDSECFLQLKSFLTPGTIYRYDFAEPNAEWKEIRDVQPNLRGFDKKNFEVNQVFYRSYDGTKIPMFIVQKKTANQGPKPVFLHAYGGLGAIELPTFNPLWFYFINAFDGIFAFAHIRGGGEYGKPWWDAGHLLNKQNSYEDFQFAAKYLVEQNYTVHEKIAIHGISNGGLMMGACINQRSDLFGAAVAEVGIMDMIRYHKFTSGAWYLSEFGNPEEKIEFENLIKYSPLHNIHMPNSTRTQYPSTLIVTADHDDRISPLHSLKFAATLQNAVQENGFQKNPIIMKVYEKEGHSDGKPIYKIIEGNTDKLTFIHRALNVHFDS